MYGLLIQRHTLLAIECTGTGIGAVWTTLLGSNKKRISGINVIRTRTESIWTNLKITTIFFFTNGNSNYVLGCENTT